MMSSNRTPRDQWPAIELRLVADGAPPAFRAEVAREYRSLVAGQAGFIREAEITPVTDLPHYDTIDAVTPVGQAALGQLAVLKLNGGLGTGMGLRGPKSLLPVRDDQTFLDLIQHQLTLLRERSGAPLPLILMNSLATDAPTRAVLGDAPVELVLQHRLPKLAAETLAPIDWPADPELTWAPPGHGDLYLTLLASGLLETFLERGIRYLFVSNADNLGATVDPALLGYLIQGQHPFLMEVALRTEADRKGGHLARSVDGRLLLREVAQCTPEDEAAFQDITRHRAFNTNSLWLDLKAVKERLAAGPLNLPVIVNRKTVDPTDPTSPAVIQLETAMGSAIQEFPGAVAVQVPRARFVPVKKTTDLLAVRSDAYELHDGQLRLHPSRTTGPIVRLDPQYYGLLADFEERFPSLPSLVACDRLTVEGDVVFGPNVHLEGEVTITNRSGPQRTIEHAVLKDEAIEL